MFPLTAVHKHRVRLLVQALRSDKYKQGKYILRQYGVRKGELHCCLGVACEVMAEVLADPTLRPRIHKDALLPMAVSQWYGFDDENPIIMTPKTNRVWWKPWQKPTPSQTFRASYANDEADLSFEQIADAFEHMYLK